MGCLDSDEAPEFMKHFDRSQENIFKRTTDILWKLKRYSGIELLVYILLPLPLPSYFNFGISRLMFRYIPG